MVSCKGSAKDVRVSMSQEELAQLKRAVAEKENELNVLTAANQNLKTEISLLRQQLVSAEESKTKALADSEQRKSEADEQIKRLCQSIQHVKSTNRNLRSKLKSIEREGSKSGSVDNKPVIQKPGFGLTRRCRELEQKNLKLENDILCLEKKVVQIESKGKD